MVCYSMLGFAVVNAQSMWNLYLSSRQLRTYGADRPLPATAQRFVTQEQFEKTQRYGRDKMRFGMARTVASLLQSNVTLYFQLMPKLWEWSVRAAAAYTPGWILRRTASSTLLTEMLHCCYFNGASEALELLVTLPFSYYRNFVIEERHGFNKMTLAEWVKDQVKSVALRTLVLNPMISALINWIVRRFGCQFPMYLFGGSTALVIAFTYVFPVVIQPLFNKFEPLKDGSLKDKITALAKQLDFPLTRLYVMDGSRRSAHSNAYMYGFWNNKRVVLFDTLLENLDESEVLAVLGHEFGHWKLNHTMYLLGAGLGELFVMCRLAKEMIYKDQMYTDLGFPQGSAASLPPLVGFGLYCMLVYEPLAELLGMGLCAVSRAFERQADDFAIRLGYGKELREGLLKMQKKSLTDVTPDWLYSTCVHTHPPILERVEAIDGEVERRERKEA